ncbi:MAG: alkyl hydroperoxide reductase subunit F [Candidatus Microthrix parvicella]
MLDANLTEQLKGHLTKVTRPIELVASLDDSPKSLELWDLLTEIAALSDNVAAVRDKDAGAQRRPSFSINRVGTDVSVGFAGIPMGHEFTSLVLALLQVGGHPPAVSEVTAEAIEQLEGEYHFVTYMSLSCQNCPDVVQALNAMSVLNSNISHVAVDGAVFPDEVERQKVMAVPTVLLNGETFGQGRMTVDEIVAKLDTGAVTREADRIDALEPLDVLVVGGGPAGASASIYAARKGIATGVIAERFGGQVLDTMSIENLISVPSTEGPKLAAALEAHVAEYDVDVMHNQRATRLTPATESGGLATVELASGATLQARTVVLSTGASWRLMGVPGEQEYRNRGVAFCPHCDGPLYKGKRVAVIGGGNSGAEAAIDLAGMVSEVTLIEFDDVLRADEVLQAKLASLANLAVITGARTTEVLGDDTSVTGLNYEDRATGELHRVELEGIFVQIGLVPNTGWLKGTVELSPRGEVVIDDRNATSVPGVFAAGDCTTVPYKQIVIALGAGSTAALSAFDHLIRTPLVVESGSVGDDTRSAGAEVAEPVVEPVMA